MAESEKKKVKRKRLSLRPSPTAVPGAKHSRIIIQRFDRGENHSLEASVLRIQQPIIFVWGQRRGHYQDEVVGILHELVSDPCEFRRRRRAAPLGWKLVRKNAFLRQIVGHLGRDEHQVRRSVVGIKVDEILEHRQRLVF
jgi:hypothetical protein